MGNPVVTPASYDLYDHGYRTGAQAHVFIGPIWAEEVLHISYTSGTSDIPVYPYSSPYYDRLLLGNYIVSGQIGIAYNEPDYLLRLIETARNESIQQDELLELIERRKSLFANTVKYRLLTEQVLRQGTVNRAQLESNALTNHIFNYVNRITREIETSSLNHPNSLDPRHFELTIIRGNPADTSQSIEIFQDVKIVGTATTNTNDDNALMEVYSFTARKKPDRISRVIADRPEGFFSVTNLMQMAKELANHLIDRMLMPPDISTTRSMRRTVMMGNTDRLGVAGLLNTNTRFSGKEAQFIELCYTFEYPMTFNEKKDNGGHLVSDTTLELYRQSGDATSRVPNITARLQPRKAHDTSGREVLGFNNSYGLLIYPDREGTARYIAAVGAVTPASLYTSLGGSIILPRFRRNEFDVGSFIPPYIIEERENFAYTENQLAGLTASTLWTCLTGFRNTASRKKARELVSADSGQERDESAFVEATQPFIAEIAQPSFSMAYIDRVRTIYTASDETYAFAVAEPIYIDYKGIAEPEPQTGTTDNTGSMRTQNKFQMGEYEKDIIIPFTSADVLGAVYKADKGAESINEEPGEADLVNAICGVIEDEVVLENVYEYDEGEGYPRDWSDGPPGGSTDWLVGDVCSVGPKAYECTTEHTPGATFAGDSANWNELGVWFDPHFFKLEMPVDSPRLATSFSKSLYVRPFVYQDKGVATNISYNSGTSRYEADWAADTTKPSGRAKCALAYFGSLSSGSFRDDSCNFDFRYDWTVENASAYTTNGQVLKINGVYFLRPTDDNYGKILADDGEYVTRSDVYNRATGEALPDVTLYVYWFYTVLPIKSLTDPEELRRQEVEVIHDLELPSGRKLEIYNITRCDVTYLSRLKWYNYNPESSIWQSIKNLITQVLENVINIFVDTNYTWPITRNMGKVAGFTRGYCFAICPQNITEQLLLSTFDESNQIDGVVQSPGRGEWTLGKALNSAINQQRRADNPSASVTQDIPVDVLASLGQVVRTLILEKTRQLGMRVLSEDTTNDIIKIYKEVVTPSPSIVSWGLTDDGYDELMELTSGDEEEALPDMIVLGGYDA